MHVRLSAVSVPVAMVLVTAASVWAAVAVSLWWLFALVPFAALAVVAVYDVLQRRHSILRNFPLLGHMRYLLEAIRPEMQQYFIERDYDGRPFDRDTRTVVYEQAKGIHEETSFGTELDVNQAGYEYVEHATVPLTPDEEQPRVRIGGPDCTQPYDMALLNVSAMSFGSLSANAIRALNAGAAGGRIRARHRRGRSDAVSPRGWRRPDLGDRQRLFQRPYSRRRLRPGAVPGQGRPIRTSSAPS